MIQPCRLGHKILRTQSSFLPRTFCRYKSITAAIERGRQGSGVRSPARSLDRNRYRENGTRKAQRDYQKNFEDSSSSSTRPASRGSWPDKTGQDWSVKGVGHKRDEGKDDGRYVRGTDRPFGRRTERGLGQQDDRRFETQNNKKLDRQDDQRFERKDDRKFGRQNNQDFEPRNDSSFGRRDGRNFERKGDRNFTKQDDRRFERQHSRRESFEPRSRDRAASAPRLSPVPDSLPYTTAASDFLYGYSSVLAAIKADRRKFYKLYIHARGLNNTGSDVLIAKAKARHINIQEVGDEYLRVLDKASNGRPHNGFILESSPLPVPPITELRSASLQTESFEVTIDQQTREDALINGTKEKYFYKSAGWRHPLVLYVDGVLDEGNLGAIARSAYFLGVDAIATPSRQTAPWSHIALKASAGAAEAIPIFTVNQSSEFLGKSAREGWRIYASDAIPPSEQAPLPETPQDGPPDQENISSSVVYTIARSSKRLSVDHCPVKDHPTILMLGAEGTGLRASLLNQAHYKVGIRHGRDVDEVGVDSLNVSVAASLLCYEILQKPQPQQKAGDMMF